MASSNKVSPNDCDGGLETAIWPPKPEIYIYRIMIANIEIPTANLGFLTMTSSKKVSTHDFDNDRLPEIGTSNMIAQTGNRVLISLEVL